MSVVEAGEDEVEEFQFWRLTDPENDQTVGTSAYSKDLAACKKFYKWAAGRYPTVADPFAGVDFPVARKTADVKWLDPSAIVRWRDLGVRGRGLDGRQDQSWRGRNEQRDGACVDGLYGTELRLAEWSSVELPRLASGCEYYTSELAGACAKGGFGHTFWMPRSVLVAVRAYVEGARTRAVREAQAAGRYEAVRRLRVVSETRGRESVVLEDEAGGTAERRWQVLGPQRRQRLFRRTAAGLEPVWLWLNEDGMPRDAHGWQHTFTGANARIAALGLQDFSAMAHMLRHSFALKWFSIGKLVNSSRLAHLDEEEIKDFREQFGNSWHLVQTMLGHRRVETTKDVYLDSRELHQSEGRRRAHSLDPARHGWHVWVWRWPLWVTTSVRAASRIAPTTCAVPACRDTTAQAGRSFNSVIGQIRGGVAGRIRRDQ